MTVASLIHTIFIKPVEAHMPLATTAQSLLPKHDHRVQSCTYAGDFQWAGSTLKWVCLKLTDFLVNGWIMENCWMSFHLFSSTKWTFLMFLFFCQEHSHDVCRPFGCDKVGNEDRESTASLQGFTLLIIRIAHWVDESWVTMCSALCLIHFSVVL